MYEDNKVEHRPVGHIPSVVEELPGETPADAASPELAEQNAEAMIRKLMNIQKREESRAGLPPLSPLGCQNASHYSQAEAPAAAPRFTKTRKMKPAAIDYAAEASQRKDVGPLRWVRTLWAHRKQIMWGCVALVVFFRPFLIPVIVFVGAWLALIVYLILGPDRVVTFITNRWDQLSQRRPEKAARIAAWADKWAVRLDAVLDRLPGKWKDQLYMPDLSSVVGNDGPLQDAPDPFDSINRQRV